MMMMMAPNDWEKGERGFSGANKEDILKAKTIWLQLCIAVCYYSSPAMNVVHRRMPPPPPFVNVPFSYELFFPSDLSRRHTCVFLLFYLFGRCK